MLPVAIGSRAGEIEAEFTGLYSVGAREVQVIEPPFNLRYLETLVQQNNALGPCIEAMVPRLIKFIDKAREGTGYT